ncbi:hypothetical protein I3843_11G136500 [Carya illinoinensis]|nr:hypothetical protein I3843_11G136500 [Carya illinoinensis]KAG7956696.1 hypothetical protein I3843_11G136500 [Carya illinoinensis]
MISNTHRAPSRPLSHGLHSHARTTTYNVDQDDGIDLDKGLELEIMNIGIPKSLSQHEFCDSHFIVS